MNNAHSAVDSPVQAAATVENGRTLAGTCEAELQKPAEFRARACETGMTPQEKAPATKPRYAEAHLTENAMLNVYSGPNATRDFIDPAKRPYTSLVELRDRHLNPFLGEDVRIFAKVMYEAPCLNIKSFSAIELLQNAQTEGKLRATDRIVESSSGNFAFALAGIARVFGIEDVESFVPEDIAPGKEMALAIGGVRYTKVANGSGQPTGIERARMAGKKQGTFCPEQYHSEANPVAHEKWTAEQIWNQTQGEMTVFCSAVGTSGTVVGASRFFKRQSAQVSIVGALCINNQTIPGVRSLDRLKEVGLDWQSALDYHYEVTSYAAYKLSLGLIRTTLMAGPSSGAGLAAAHMFLTEMRRNRQLDRLRNKERQVVLVFICADTFYPYLDTYMKILNRVDFA